MKILISPGYGAGWSTWNNPGLATDKRLVELFEKGCTQNEMIDACVEYGYTNVYGDPPYDGGFADLKIVEVPKGSLFKIREYDGHEYVEIFDESEWTRAEEQSVVIIEDKGKIKFLENGKELSLREGFKKLDVIYNNEPLENRKIIDRLRNKYQKVQGN